jgi:hypothetical protein
VGSTSRNVWINRLTVRCSGWILCHVIFIYEDRLKSSWTQFSTPSRNFVEVRWRSHFRSTSLGKRCTSYNAPPTSWKRVADRWSLRNLLLRSSLFMVGKAQKSHEVRPGLYGGCSDGVPPIHFYQAEHRIQFRSRPMRFWAFQTMKRELRGKKFRSDQRSATRFREVGVSSASLAKEGISRKRPSLRLHNVSTRNNKVSPRTLLTALVV